MRSPEWNLHDGRPELSFSFFLFSQCKGTARRQLSASQEESPRTEFANSLILDFPACRLARSEFTNTLILDFSASRPTRNMHLLFRVMQSAIFCYSKQRRRRQWCWEGGFEHVLRDSFTGKPLIHAEWNKRMQGPSY